MTKYCSPDAVQREQSEAVHRWSGVQAWAPGLRRITACCGVPGES